jgi:MFS family permease
VSEPARLATVATPPPVSPRRAWYAVGVLTLAYAVAFVDRQILAMMVEPIRRDLQIGDFAVSLLLGLAFAAFYTVLGVPLARLADRSNRRNLIAAGILLWSLATAACGLARNYAQLFLARMSVGIGEAVLSPAALSLITDSFPRAQLARAIAVYSIGMSTGGGIATLLGALLLPQILAAGTVSVPIAGDVRPWQAVFFLVGLPGIVVAALMLTVREPPRVASRGAAGLPLATVLGYLREHRQAVLGHFLGMSVLTIMGYGVGYWIPSFFLRSYALSPEAAREYLFAYGILGTLVGAGGIALGGWYADRCQRQRSDGYLSAALLGVVLLVPGYALFPLMPTPELALALLALGVLGGSIPAAGGAAAVMLLAPSRMRAQVSALYYLTLNLLGLGLGPSLVAALTEFVFRDPARLRWSIAIVALTAGACAALTLASIRPAFRRTVAAASAFDTQAAGSTTNSSEQVSTPRFSQE